jgi:spore coat polysaccharide biosynthesis predicted glycosyltransferase SpsG
VLSQTSSVAFCLDRDGTSWATTLKRDGYAIVDEESIGQDIWRGSVLDVYEDVEVWAQLLLRHAYPLTFLDDHLVLPPAASMVVNAGAEPSATTGFDGTALLGPQYALIDSAFSAVGVERAMRPEAKCLLISFGRVDSRDATGLVLDAISKMAGRGNMPFQRIVVVLGANAPNLPGVRSQVASLEGKAVLLLDTDRMPDLLAAADLAVGAGGVGLFERMAAALPSVTVTTADNQRLGVDLAAEAGACVSLGSTEQIDADLLSGCLLDLAADHGARKLMGQRARNLVDGRGAERVAAQMNALTASAQACLS